MLHSLSAVLSIVVINLVLSGDNAIVIGMASRRLSPENRRKAIILGGGGAIGLRVVFTALAAVLLAIPGLQAVGGTLLFYLAYKLIRPQHGQSEVKQATGLADAIITIILADFVMSLDNILAVGGAAQGDFGLMLFGLAFSIPIILFGSELVARLLSYFPAFLYLGVFVLVHAAVGLILDDARLPVQVELTTIQALLVSAAITGAIAGLARLLDHAHCRQDGGAAALALTRDVEERE